MEHLVWVVLGLLFSLHQTHGSRRDDSSGCRPVTASFCHGLGNATSLHPGGVSGYSLQLIGLIVDTACSPDVATLMCRVVVPECGPEDDGRLKPCRALCEKVQSDCESVLKAQRLQWPTRLRCDALAEYDCVQDEMVKLLWLEYGSKDEMDYDEYVSLLAKLHILKERFQAHVMNLPCVCQVASFSFKHFMKSAII